MSNKKINIGYRMLNDFLISKGYDKPYSMLKPEKIGVYCKLIGCNDVITRKQSDAFVKKEMSRVDSPIYLAEKISVKKKWKPTKIKKKDDVNDARKRRKVYSKYIHSEEWKDFRLSIIRVRGYRCEKCGETEGIIHAHHLTYERFMKEIPSDIMLLCIPCHNDVHRKPNKKK